MEQIQVVAPYVGAWIETDFSLDVDLPLSVAPYVGAWIETCSTHSGSISSMSHLTWVRGLKHG